MIEALRNVGKNYLLAPLKVQEGLRQAMFNGTLFEGLNNIDAGLKDLFTFGLYSEGKNKLLSMIQTKNENKTIKHEENEKNTVQKEFDEITKQIKKQEADNVKPMPYIIPNQTNDAPKTVKKKENENNITQKEFDEITKQIKKQEAGNVKPMPYIIPNQTNDAPKTVMTEQEYLDSIKNDAFNRIDGKGNNDGKVTIDEALKDLQDTVLSQMKNKNQLSANINEVLKQYAGEDKTFSAEEWAEFLNGDEWNNVLKQYRSEQKEVVQEC